MRIKKNVKRILSFGMATVMAVSLLVTGGGSLQVEAAEAPDASSAVNYTTILGRATDYGIVTPEFYQNDHMETTIAVNDYYNIAGQANDVDLAGDKPVHFIVGDVKDSFGETPCADMTFDKTYNLAPMVYNVETTSTDKSRIHGTANFPGQVKYKTQTYESITKNVNNMIQHAIDESNELAGKTKAVPVSSVGSLSGKYIIDLTDSSYENTTVYINVTAEDTDFLNALRGTDDLFIKKCSSTVVVFNVLATSNNAPGAKCGKEPYLEGENADSFLCIGQYTVFTNEKGMGPNDGINTTTTFSGNESQHNKEVDAEIAQKIIFNMPNASNISLKTAAATFIAPKKDVIVTVDGPSAGWIVANGKVKNNTEFHYVYHGRSENENSDDNSTLHFAAKKLFTKSYNATTDPDTGNKSVEEDTTVFLSAQQYSFTLYNATLNESGEYVQGSAVGSVTNYDTNKIKFPDLTIIGPGTYHYIIKEDNSASVPSGISVSDGEIDIELIVREEDGVLYSTVNSKQYLTAADKASGNVFKSNNGVEVSGVEFSLGGIYNLVTDEYKIGSIELEKKLVDSDGNPIEYSQLSDSAKENIIFTVTGPKSYSKTISLSKFNSSGKYIINNLPIGEYTVTETVNNGEYLIKDYKYTGNTITNNGNVTVTADTKSGVTVTNEFESSTSTKGLLELKKLTTKAPDSYSDKEYSVRIYNGNGYLKENGELSDDPYSIKIKANQTISIETEELGQYTIEELDASDEYYTVAPTYSSSNVTISAGNISKETITNDFSEKKGSLILTKEFLFDGTKIGYLANNFDVNNISFDIVKAGTSDVVATCSFATNDGQIQSSFNKTINDLPVGSYEVIEHNNQQSIVVGPHWDPQSQSDVTETYVYSATTGTSSFTIENDGDNKTVSLVNEYVTGTAPTPVDVNLSASKTYTIDGTDQTLTADQFGFTLTKDGETTAAQTKGNAADGSVKFDKLTFNQTGTYKYKVAEVKGSDSEIDYDATVYDVEIVVTKNDAENKLEAATTIKKSGTVVSSMSFTNTKTTVAPTPVDVILSANKTYTIDGTDQTLTADQFSFTLTEDGSSVATQTKGNATDGSVKFDKLTFNQTGTYKYKVAEVKGSDSEIDYDATVYDVEIVVTKNDAENKLEAATTIKKSGTAVSSMSFTNTKTTVAPTPVDVILSANKTYTIDGTDQTLTADQFSFTLTEDGSSVATQTKGNATDGSVNFDKLTFNQTGTYKYKVAEVKGSDSEIDYDATVYDVEIVVTKNDAENKLEAATTIKKSGTAVSSMSFTNTKTTVAPTPVDVILSANKTYTIDGTAQTLTADQFSFTLTEDGSSVATQTKGNAADGSVKFDKLTFNQTGTYKYKVAEVKGSDSEIDYDATVYDVEIVVTKNDAENKLEAATTIKKSGTAVSSMSFTNTKTTPAPTPVDVKLSASKTYTIDGTDQTLTADQFSFTLTEDGSSVATQTKGNATDGSVKFDKLTFDLIGTYKYKVAEVKGSDSEIDYDATVYDVEIVVTKNDAENKLEAATTIKKSGTAVSSMSFTNTKTTVAPTPVDVNLSASKTYTIDGTDQTLTADQFSFTLTEDGSSVATQTKGNAADGSVKFDKLTFNQTGTYKYKVAEVKGSDSEIDYDATVYDVEIVVTKNDAENKLEAATTIKKSGTAVSSMSFTNTKTTVAPTPVDVILSANKTYTIDGTDQTLTADQFSFTLTEDGSSVATQTKGNATDGSVKFDKLTFNQTGTYKYKVAEVKGSDSEIDYDATVYDVEIVVTKNDAENKLEAATTIKKSGTAVSSMSFTNTKTTVAPTPVDVILSANKTYTIDGTAQTLTADQFSFTLTEDGSSVATQTKGNAADGSVKFDKLTFNQTGTYKYKVAEVKGSDSEIDYDATVYDVEIVVTKNDAENKLEAATTITKNGSPATLAFVNTKTTTPTPAPTPATVNLTANKTYTIDGTAQTLTADQFSFTLTKDGETTAAQTKGNAADGTVTFDTIIYDQPGTYTYHVAEVKGSDSTIDYDTSVYDVVVEVTKNDAENKLEATTTITKSGVASSMSFSNTKTTTGKLTLTKTFGGDVTKDEIAGDTITFEIKCGNKWLNTSTKQLQDSPYEILLSTLTPDSTGLKYSMTIEDIPSGNYDVIETNKSIYIKENGQTTGIPYTLSTTSKTTDSTSVSATTAGTLELTDNYTKPAVKISKIDATGKQEIEGAELVLYSSDAQGNKTGTFSKTWTSKKSVETFYLEAGTYTIQETVAPSGYEKTTNLFIFKVEYDSTDNDKLVITQLSGDHMPGTYDKTTGLISFENDPIKATGGLKITVLEEGTKRVVPNATVEVEAPEGTTFPDGSTKITVVTDSNGQVTKYTGKDGKEYKLTEGLTPGDYKITVTKVPDGYKVTVGKTETVTVKTGEVAEHVALIATSETSKDETPSKEETKPGTPNKDTTKVDTGDHMNVIPIIVIMVISLIASIVVIIRKRKMRYEY